MGAAKIDFDDAIDADNQAILQATIDAIVASNALLLATGNAKGSINSKRYNVGSVNSSSLQQVPELPPSNTITFILRKHDQIVASRTVTSTKAFRLPSGYKDDVFSVQVISQTKIREIRFAETPEKLRDL